MFDLRELKIVRREEPNTRSFSFVGVRSHPESKTPEFWLPQGFQGFPEGDFDRTVAMFFTLYRVMRIYASKSELKDDVNAVKREAFEHVEEGINLDSAREKPLLTFAKLNLLESVLDSFDELVISSVLTKNAERQPETYERIYRHLHNGIFLDDDTIYLDRIPSLRREVRMQATELVMMFCYIYVELNRWLREESSIPPSVLAYAASFKEQFLPNTSGLFSEEGFEQTTSILKDTLTNIERGTAYKDDDFWQLFLAVEAFLYGDISTDDPDGVIWGISDYHPIWEDICHSYCTQLIGESGGSDLYFADSSESANTAIGNRRIFKRSGWENPFRLERNGGHRHMYPDLVYRTLTTRESSEQEFQRCIDVQKISAEARDVYDTVVFRGKSGVPSGMVDWWLKEVHRQLKKLGWTRVQLQGHTLRCHKIPRSRVDDAVRKAAVFYHRTGVGSKADAWFLMDFKYHNYEDFFTEELSGKLKHDVVKQLVYRLALQHYIERNDPNCRRIRSQFIIPIYDESWNEDYLQLPKFTPSSIGTRPFCHRITKEEVEVWGLNFTRAADHYISAHASV